MTNNPRAKVMVSKNLLSAIEEMYPEANSATSALQMHLIKTIQNSDQLASKGITNEERQNPEH